MKSGHNQQHDQDEDQAHGQGEGYLSAANVGRPRVVGWGRQR